MNFLFISIVNLIQMDQGLIFNFNQNTYVWKKIEDINDVNQAEKK